MYSRACLADLPDLRAQNSPTEFQNVFSCLLVVGLRVWLLELTPPALRVRSIACIEEVICLLKSKNKNKNQNKKILEQF